MQPAEQSQHSKFKLCIMYVHMKAQHIHMRYFKKQFQRGSYMFFLISLPNLGEIYLQPAGSRLLHKDQLELTKPSLRSWPNVEQRGCTRECLISFCTP